MVPLIWEEYSFFFNTYVEISKLKSQEIKRIYVIIAYSVQSIPTLFQGNFQLLHAHYELYKEISYNKLEGSFLMAGKVIKVVEKLIENSFKEHSFSLQI